MSTTQTLPAPLARAASGRGGYVRSSLRQSGMLLALLVIMAFFEVLTQGTLLRPLNLTNLVLQNSYIVIMALGMLLVIVSGHIDLSVGSVSGFIGGLAAVLIVQAGLDPWIATVICLACGGLIGGAQGWFVAFWRVPSFIVTLAGMLVFKGLSLALLLGQSVGPFPPAFQHLSSGFIPSLAVVDLAGLGSVRVLSLVAGIAVAALLLLGSVRRRARALRQALDVEPTAFFAAKAAVATGVVVALAWLLATYRGLPNVLIVMGVLIAAYAFVTNRTTVGRRIYALGGNEKAARLSGIRTERLTFLTFVNMGVLAALAGLVFAARLNTATPKAGQGFELDVIAACFIGGASAYGGVGTVIGTVIGAFIMGVMNNGMSIMGLGIDYQQVIKGLVLLAAVFVDVYQKNR